MPWLTVLGRGSWRWNDQTFRAGVHEVSDEVAIAARAAPVRNLVVTVDRPVVHVKTRGPLTISDLQRPYLGTGVRFAGQRPTEEPVAARPSGVPLDHPCGQCDEMFPSAGARDRHIEFHHAR